jgi:FkbM family methyltransferase
MKALKGLFLVSWTGRSPVILIIFIINLMCRKFNFKFRIRRFKKKKIKLYSATYFTNTWDGLLVLLPTHEILVHEAIKSEAMKCSKGIFVNVGAHIGRYCFEFAKNFEKTLAYEPTAATFSLLSEAWQQHPEKEKICVINKGLSDKSGFAQLILKSDESKNSIVIDSNSKNELFQEIKISKLDDELSEEEKINLRFLLIDVEGAEESVLRGAELTLRAANAVIFVELLSEDARTRVDALLCSFGYGGQRIDQTNWAYRKPAV